MDHRDAGRYWDGNANTWTRLAREGYDVYRDYLNAPAFLRLLPDVAGLEGLDIGCSEGYNARLVARRGARMTALDVSPRFARLAADMEAVEPAGITYLAASGQELPFADGSFDFAMATMSLMDMPRPDHCIRDVRRVLRPGGFLQFSITHPCFSPPYRRVLRDVDGRDRVIAVADYFGTTDGRVDEFLFSAAPPSLRETCTPFRVPIFHRPLSWWLNSVTDAGFTIERVEEPYADEATARECPAVADTQVVAYFLHMRCRCG